MKTRVKLDPIQTIKNNSKNAKFFEASRFHGDKSYEIINYDGQKIFRVTTFSGVAHYKLNKSTIGDYINL